MKRLTLLAAALGLALASWSHAREAVPSVLIRDGTVVDGTGGKPRRADVRVTGERIVAVGSLRRGEDERVVEARDLVVAPGFIDAHSHAERGIAENPDAATHVRQGITTAVVGQDGGSPYPLSTFFKGLQARPAALNFASFAGHGTVRRQVMGEDFRRPARPEEVRRMRELVRAEMDAGALGLSTGLEYDPGIYATTEEVIACAQATGGGLYISHMRDEGDGALTSIRELLRIAGEAKVPAQVSHVKLASRAVWGKAGEALALVDEANRQGRDISLDVYPYLFWQSTITAMTTSRDFENLGVWEKALADVGGPERVLLTVYAPNPAWAGKTLAALERETGRPAAELIREIVRATRGTFRSEAVVVTAMEESDLRAFLRHPKAMICSDAGLTGTHPRTAGSFPRVLGRYVREERVLKLEEAVRKMTSLPARRFGFRDRGEVRPGKKADLVLFDPRKVADRATIKDPLAAPVGIPYVMVNGRWVLKAGKLTGQHPGQPLRR